MIKKINFFIVLILISNDLLADKLNQSIEPEPSSVFSDSDRKNAYGDDFVVVTANNYATELGFKILELGGSVIDAAVTIQLTLGLVEPQSSGLGGGMFATYYDASSRKTFSFEGRETAPKDINSSIFLEDNGKPKKFFDAVVGGLSVGVPSTLKTLKQMHEEYGLLEWEKLIDPVIKFTEDGFLPPRRLLNALKKDKFFLKKNSNSSFKKILENPNTKFVNNDYAESLKTISKNYEDFYSGEIAKNIVVEVRNSENPGKLSLKDLKDYKPKKQQALCMKLESGYKVCGPNLPSSGTICILQILQLYEDLKNKNIELGDILEIINFVYYVRDKQLADDEYEKINLKKLLSLNFLKTEFQLYKEERSSKEIENFDQIFNSTSHFSLVDKYGNILSLTSSIESSFGSKIIVNGFILNNQLTDFSFKTKDQNGELIKNRPESGKRPLSSMAPLIIFDKNNDFILTIGSPGGKAIISYVARVLIDIFYNQIDSASSIRKPNYIKIRDKTFVENEDLKKNLKQVSKIRNLTSGLAIIENTENGFNGIADFRRDGTAKGK
ncbi:MAG: hypothetical protein CMP32_02795 [Rickettsiales bacterium]|nr:hypothetical protein [Rickettsiales bacterium]